MADVGISIHAPRTGSDSARCGCNPEWCHFNPRSPHGERRDSAGTGTSAGRHFNPRSPHGERQSRFCSWKFVNDFNPRSPHGERPICISFPICSAVFQSTLPARGATANAADVSRASRISIHAPRTGSDLRSFPGCKSQSYFNPRSPHGERLVYRQGAPKYIAFQSTLPARGATRRSYKGFTPDERISIHAPRTGSDASN